jgi:arylsulfatase
MTGRHPLKNGVTHTILERERMALAATTLPQVLKSRGYQCGIFGKWHLGDEDPYQPIARGFDESFIHGAGGIGQAYDCSCADVPGNRYTDPVIRHNGRFVQTSGFCTDVFFDAALRWIDSQRSTETPFFAYLATNAPHAPYRAPEANLRRFQQLGFRDDPAGFYGMVENIDENVGRLLEQFDAWDLWSTTVVIFMSDNGMAAEAAPRDHQPLGTQADGTPILAWNSGMKGLKGSPDEGGVRVPFFVRWDGVVQPGRDVDCIAAHIDVLPTLADLCGASLPEGQVEGRSLRPLLESATAAAAWPDRYLFTHVGRWPVGADPDAFQWRGFAVRNQRFRLVGGQLFDMTADPGQEQDVAADHPQVVSEMRAAFDAFWQSARPLMINERVPLSATRPYWLAFEAQTAGSPLPRWPTE